METFKYYKRGKGELDTSNFPQICENRVVTVDRLDEKTFMSLVGLNQYARWYGNGPEPINVIVKGYVAHMRGDKDEFNMSTLYNTLHFLNFTIEEIQHESTFSIQSATLPMSRVYRDFGIDRFDEDTCIIGADSSVPKIMPQLLYFAKKVRENGKVTSLEFPAKTEVLDNDRIIIVDDILGGGKTIQMLVDILRGEGYTGDLLMWVAYNEGIHTGEFLDQFKSVYLGETI